MITRRLALASLLPFLLAAAPAAGQPASRVTALRLAPSGSQTALTIEVDGAGYEWSDFTLENPARVVVDIDGARNELRDRYDAINRGGILSLRASQYMDNTVRVVIDLDLPSIYAVERVPQGIRVTFSAGASAFQPWSSGGQSVPAAAPGAVTTRVASQSLQQQAQRIDVIFENADIRDVLAHFAEFTGRSIVPGSGVTGNVTATITDQPWDVALETILRAYGLAAVELPSGIIRVDAIERLREREVQEPLITQNFRINYVPSAELVETLTPMLTERGRLVSNPSTNTLVVSDIEGVVNGMGSMIQQLDIQTPQVSIQAKIIFINRTNIEELGVSYDLKDSRGNRINRLVQSDDPRTGQPTSETLINLGGSSIAALGNATSRVVGPSLETVASLVLGRYTLVAFLDALQAAELSDVQAAPTVTTLDNQEAEIFVGEETPIRVVDVASAGGAGVARASAQLVSTGIRLLVTPHVTANRQILMELEAERSSAQLAATDIGVNFQRQRGRTRLLVNDGESAVIGGLTVTEVTQTRAGIPFLMDIPYLGALFRTTRNREQKRDLLILVTPHIVDTRI